MQDHHMLQSICKQLCACLQVKLEKKGDTLLELVMKTLTKAGHYDISVSCIKRHSHVAICVQLLSDGEKAAGKSVVEWGEKYVFTVKELCLTLRKFADKMVAELPNPPRPDDINELVQHINILLVPFSTASG
jgi:HKD family nuclease